MVYRKRQQGIALVLVLWVVSLLTVIAAAFSSNMRTEANLARNLVDSARARHIAEAGINHAIAQLLAPDTNDSWKSAGKQYSVSFGDSKVEISILDEAGKLDINTAHPELIDGLLKVLGQSRGERLQLVDAIQDWRDPDDLVRLNGAEKGAYHRAGLGYPPKNSSFEAVEELILVSGMTPGLYQSMAPLLTVHSGHAGINPATADPLVLAAVPGIDNTSIEEYLAARNTASPENSSGRQQLSNDRRYLIPGSRETYTIRADSHLPGGAAASIEVSVRLSYRDRYNPYTILRWREPATRSGSGYQADSLSTSHRQ